MRATGSVRQTAMHEPSTVLRTDGSRAARTPPMWMTASCRSTGSRTPRALFDNLPVDAVAEVLELGAQPEQRFRAPQKEAAAGPQQLDEPGDASLLEGAVEVDEDVTAEDTVQRRPDGTALGQVDPPEGHQLSDLRAHLHRCMRGPGAADEVLRAQRGRHSRHLLNRVDSIPRLRQHLGVDVGGQDSDVPRPSLAEGVQDRERDAVGLLAAGAAGAPDPEPPRRATPDGRRRKDRGAEDGEVALVPEELGLVGRDGVEHAEELVPIRIAVQEMLVVLGEGGIPVPPESLAQPRAHELALVVPQGDSGLPTDERAESPELLIGDPERTNGTRDPFGGRRYAGHSLVPIRALSSRGPPARPRRPCRAPGPGRAG